MCWCLEEDSELTNVHVDDAPVKLRVRILLIRLSHILNPSIITNVMVHYGTMICKSLQYVASLQRGRKLYTA